MLTSPAPPRWVVSSPPLFRLATLILLSRRCCLTSAASPSHSPLCPHLRLNHSPTKPVSLCGTCSAPTLHVTVQCILTERPCKHVHILLVAIKPSYCWMPDLEIQEKRHTNSPHPFSVYTNVANLRLTTNSSSVTDRIHKLKHSLCPVNTQD